MDMNKYTPNEQMALVIIFFGLLIIFFLLFVVFVNSILIGIALIISIILVIVIFLILLANPIHWILLALLIDLMFELLT